MPNPNSLILRNIQKSRAINQLNAGLSFDDDAERLTYVRANTYNIANNFDSGLQISEDDGDKWYSHVPGGELIDEIAVGWSHLYSALNDAIYKKNSAELSNEQERLRINNEREEYLKQFLRYMELYDTLTEAGVQDPLGERIQPS